jgi:DNA-directed RNA polymerase II subunit RPB2
MTKAVIVHTPEGDIEEEKQDYEKIFIGEVPIMLRSSYCSLFDHTDKELTDLGECPYDQV